MKTSVMELKCISSRRAFYFKRIFPIFWFGILALIAGLIICGFGDNTTHSSTINAHAPLFFLIMPFIMAVFVYVMMKKLIFDLVDGVHDGGDFLLVKNEGRVERIALTNIKHVNFSGYVNPPRITLTVREACSFGDKISFSPIVRFADFKTLGTRNAIADDLISRVDVANNRT